MVYMSIFFQVDESIPIGWGMYYDSNGREYYIHHDNMTVQYENPMTPMVRMWIISQAFMEKPPKMSKEYIYIGSMHRH